MNDSDTKSKAVEALRESLYARQGSVALIGTFLLFAATLYAGYDIGGKFVEQIAAMNSHDAQRIEAMQKANALHERELIQQEDRAIGISALTIAVNASEERQAIRTATTIEVIKALTQVVEKLKQMCET